MFHIHSTNILCEYFLILHKIGLILDIKLVSIRYELECVLVKNIRLHRLSPLISTYAPSFWYYYCQKGKDKGAEYVYLKTEKLQLEKEGSSA